MKVRHKTEFKKRLRDAQRPPEAGGKAYKPPPRPPPQEWRRAEDLCKELAHDEEPVRDQALEDLGRFLRWLAEEGVERDVDFALEYGKLWKGVFYCLWHADKPLVQLACADRIAELTDHVGAAGEAEWALQGWRCVEREWPLIDKWRVEKYYALMRRMLRRHLASLAAAWRGAGAAAASAAAAPFLSSLREVYDSPRTGIGCHVSDCFVDECVSVGLPHGALLSLLRDLLVPVLSLSTSQLQCDRIDDRVFRRLCGEVTGATETDEALAWMSGVPWDEVAEACADAAVAPGTRSANRALLSSLQERIEALLEQAAEVAELHEMDSDEEMGELRDTARREYELKSRLTADSTVTHLAERAKRRKAQKLLAKAKRQGDISDVRRAAKQARAHGVKLPKRKKKKGKGKLAQSLAVAGGSAADLGKQQKMRRRKRRI